MSRHSLLALALLSILSLSGNAGAEVFVDQKKLSLQAEALPLVQVLQELSRESRIHVTVLEGNQMDNVLITERFDNLSIEDGLSRLLVNMNYGLTRDHVTGDIQEIFLASKRGESAALPTTVRNDKQARNTKKPVQYHDSPEGFFEYAQEDEGQDDGEVEFAEPEDSERDEQYVDGGQFPEDLIPADLPPEIREAMLRDITASRENR